MPLAVTRSTSPRHSRQSSTGARDRMTDGGAGISAPVVASVGRAPRNTGVLARAGSDRAFDILGLARTGTDVASRRADQPAGALLLEDVGTPACRPGAGEHGREHVWRHLGEVQHDR